METLQVINISLDEFKKLIRDTIIEVLPKLNNREDIYLTRDEVCDKLKISLVTLNNWTKKGLIPSYRIGRRVRYLESEVQNSLHEIRSLKYRRVKLD